MKNTEKKALIETMEFDSYAFAKQTHDDAERKLGKIKIGMIISAAASLATVLAFSAESPDSPVFGIGITIAVIGALASYIIGGGIKIALRAVKKLAFFGWFILPFPIDLATGAFTLIVAPVAFFLLPVIFVFINYIQVKRNRDEAAEYMSFCRPVAATEPVSA